MGYVSGYDLIAYCDVCNKDIQIGGVETKEEANNVLRDAGYKLNADGTVICNECLKNSKYKILPESKRTGSLWHSRWGKYVRKNKAIAKARGEA